MTRFLLAAVLVAALGTSVGAQLVSQPTPQPTPAMPEPVQPIPPPPPALYQPDVYIPPGARPGPAIPYHKMGGTVAGAYGFYPYDSGDWLLAENFGTTRQSGSFTMMYPSVFPAPAQKKHMFCKPGIFQR